MVSIVGRLIGTPLRVLLTTTKTTDVIVFKIPSSKTVVLVLVTRGVEVNWWSVYQVTLTKTKRRWSVHFSCMLSSSRVMLCLSFIC